MAQLRRRHAFALGLATASGLFAATLINDFTQSEIERARKMFAHDVPEIKTTPVVVASDELRMGQILKQEQLKEIQWPADSVPEGTFRSVGDLFKEQGTRVIMEGMRNGEPVLTHKITGPGQRAGLATILDDGKKAISVRVNDVIGVSGFLVPGDYVDLLLTNTTVPQGDGDDTRKAATPNDAYTDLLLENIRVLAVDQSLDPKDNSAKVARTVTLEATLTEAQRITLASTVGTISLVLRKSSETNMAADWQRVSVANLSGDSGDKGKSGALQVTNAFADSNAKMPPDGDGGRHDRATVNIVRSAERSEYLVSKGQPQ